MSDLKVINLGLPKSGTTTLGTALTHAGFKVADWKVRPGQAKRQGFVGGMMYTGYFRSGDPLSLMRKFDAFAEIDVVRNGLSLWPQCDWGLISALREKHPGARFLLSHREPEALADSMRRWSNLGTARLPANTVPGLPAGFGKRPGELERWIAGHYSFLRQVFDGAEDFLEYDILDTEAPKKIGGFLGRDLPWWGQANQNPTNPAQKAAS